MLLERDAELALIDDYLQRSRQRRGGTLLLCGEPGIGKSALMLGAVAAAPGLVLRARGVEVETEMPFVALRDLVAPVSGQISELPELQRRALLGALAIEDHASVEQFAVCVGTLTLLSLAAQQDPLLVVVDDLQWVDAASLSVLRFVARRIGTESIALLLAAREPPEGFDEDGCTVHQITGLSLAGVQTLLDNHRRAANAVTLHRATGGNPLAVTELLHEGNDRLLEADGILEPLPVNDVIRDAFGKRLTHISKDGQAALLVAAATERSELSMLVAAAERLNAGLRGFVEAEAAEVISMRSGELMFRHPIMRSVIYSGAAPHAQRAAHQALAQGAELLGRGDEAAWHLASAAILPDEEVAARLETAAKSYERRSGHFAAAQALVRAAQLSPEANVRARRLHEAAESARRAGRGPWALELLDAAAATARGSSLKAEIEFTRAILLSWCDPAAGASHRFEELANRTETMHPEIAATAYGYGAAEAVVEGDIAAARRQAQHAVAVAERDGVSAAAREVALQAQGTVLVLSGDPDGPGILRKVAQEMLTRNDLTGREYLALPLIWLEEYDLVWQLLGPRLQDVRNGGDIRALTASLEVEATLRYRTGDWTRAQAAAAESARLAEDSSQTVQLAYSLATLAIVQAGQGQKAAQTSADRAAQLGAELGLAELDQYVWAAKGLFALGQGDVLAALASVERAADYAARAGQREPAVHQWMADLLDAAVLAKDRSLAQHTIAKLSAHESRPWAQAVAWRGTGMTAVADEYAAAFEQAMIWHDRTVAPFERARTHLWWGRRLRRDRRRVEARGQLETALAMFEHLNARPWAEATHRELVASGERLRRDETARDELTPQEAQITALVAAGASNRDIAGTMYLSPKTVEAHLSRIYRKFGVHSRAQLAVCVLTSGEVDAAAARSDRP